MTMHLRSARRATAAIGATLAVGAALAACSPGEEPSSTPGTTAPVITGDQAPNGGGTNDGSSASNNSSGTETGGSSPASGGGSSATLRTASGADVGTARFTSEGATVKIDVKVTSGLPGGFHGMHIHSTGKCEANSTAPGKDMRGNFLSAGGHLQVGGRTDHPASGDLVSIYIGSNGAGETVTTSNAFSLSDIAGKSIIIHEKADNFGNIPSRYAPAPDQDTLSTGDAGARLACGLIS